MRRTYKHEIKTVYENDICMGFIARRSVIHGMAQEINNGWMFTKYIIAPLWIGNYPTRKRAIKSLLDYGK